MSHATPRAVIDIQLATLSSRRAEDAMSQAFRQAGATAIAMAILCVCGWQGISSCMAGSIEYVTTAAGEQALARSNTAALQGNGKLAAAVLLGVPRNHFVGRDIAYRHCMLRRFGAESDAPTQPETGDAFVSDVLHLYQTYWWHALMSPPERDSQRARLKRDLSTLLGEQATIEDWNVLEASVAATLLKRGYHSQFGVTPPLRELMIWRKQESSQHQVELPEGSYPVQLELLNDFVTRGWSAYARCDRSSNAGWATQDRLYAVGPAFATGMNNDAFRASLLGHETQHFADLTRFPDLTSWELEYRAKLTELWLSRESLSWLLGKFHRDQGDDEQVPHLFANRHVMHSLHAYLSAQGTPSRNDLLDVAPETLRAAAREVLLQDSRARDDPASMAGTLPATSP